MARQKFGIRNTIINVSHTHSGPLTWELRSPWYAQAEDKMVEAIGKAKAAMFPATLEMSTGRIYLGHNRRKIVDGKGDMWWRNAEKLPSHPLDPDRERAAGEGCGRQDARRAGELRLPSVRAGARQL